MTASPEKTLTLIEVSRLVFRTKTPGEAQVARIQRLMQSGLLRDCNCSGPPTQWTTTMAAVADYLAKESLKRQAAKHATITNDSTPAPSLFDGSSATEPENSAQLKSLYKGLWSEYFLTVFMQRKAVNRSAHFKKAVLAGQVGLLLGLFLLMASAVKLTTVAIPPERAAVERWLQANTEQYAVRTWHDPVPATNGEGKLLRVQYSYQMSSSKPVVTDRTFLVIGDEARLIVESD